MSDTAQILLLILLPVTFAASAWLTGWVRPWLIKRQFVDQVTARSSHSVPTPRGGGLAIMLCVLPALALFWSLLGVGAGAWVLLILAAGLCLLSFLDDRNSLPARLRFGVQALAVALGLWALPAGSVTLGGVLPVWLGAPLVFVSWLWFVNLFNFMDGIDGISGTQCLVVGGGATLLIGALELSDAAAGWLVGGAVIAAAALGFLVHNWHPAKLFMGDVGSIGLGYLLGALLVVFCAAGYWPVALILPAYYWADATFTLLRRIGRREKIWQAHRTHAYQFAVHRGGLKPDEVSLWIGLVGLLLIGIAALLPFIGAWAALGLAALPVLAVLQALGGPGVPETPRPLPDDGLCSAPALPEQPDQDKKEKKG